MFICTQTTKDRRRKERRRRVSNPCIRRTRETLSRFEHILEYVGIGHGFRSDRSADRFTVAVEHAFHLSDRVLVFDHFILQLMPFVAQIRKNRILLDQQLFDALILGKCVRVHLAQLCQLIGQARESVLHFHGLFVLDERVNRLELLQFQGQTLLFRVHGHELFGKQIVLLPVAILATKNVSSDVIDSSPRPASMTLTRTYHVFEQLFVLAIQMIALFGLNMKLFDARFVLYLEFLQFLHQQGEFVFTIGFEHVAFVLDQRETIL